MTGLELFPRGKGPSSAAPDGAGKGKARGSEESKGSSGGKGQGDPKRKRKAAESPAAASGGQKDWLFGAPQSNEAAPGSGKKAREGDAAGSNTGRGKAGHGKSGSAVSDVGSALLVEHSGRAPRLARVSFKKLTKGTLALGVIFKINEHDMVVSLPSSLTGVVRRKEVSDCFYLKAAAAGAHKQANRASGGRGRYFEDASADDKPLKDFFTEGQVVRCAITNLAKEVGGRHIELSLRASVLNKGLSLSHLTKGCGVYGSVVSSEDHGYVVTLGLEGVTAFLPKANAPDAGLEVGQPVEAVIQTVKAAARTVTLSAEPSLVASAVAKGTAFDLRSLKPGMLVDTIVDTVVSNGMLVSFLGYFAGCVDHNNMPVVSGDSKEEEGGWRSMFRPGPEPVRARVLMVDYVNKAIRLTLRPHLLEMRAPSGLPPTGALLEGEVVRVDPTLGLLLRVPSKEGDGGAGATGNAPVEKKEKGQARRERRAAAAAAAAALEASGGEADAEEGSAGMAGMAGSVGAYVHISRISDERVEHVDKSYKAGQKVRCRVTGSSLVEGWAAASLRPSVLSAAVLRYQDLAVGDSVEGEVAAVEAFGLLVKLGEGVRALVPKNHLGDVKVKNPKARFKVGARVKGRVLTVDAGSSKATLTLKKTMVKDKRAPITSYQEAKEGMACTGFVTKVAPFGLHVSFYGNVFGLLPAKALTRHGIHDPAEAFSAGQVVGCVVRSCDTTAYPPKLSLALDVAGKTEQMGDATAQEDDAENKADDAKAVCPFSPGDIVSGAVASAPLGAGGVLAVDLIFSNKKKKKDKKSLAKSSSSSSTVRGVLPISHLGDHASVCDETLASKLTPGTSIDKLLVLEVDKSGVPVVSLKPLLLSAAAAAAKASSGGEGESKEAFLPREASELSPGDLVAGFVSRVESFGVFVKFLGRFSALCPRSMVADRTVEDPRGMFTEGDSVRCVVQRVDVDTGRVVVTLNRTTVSASPGLYLRSFLSEAFASSNSQEGEGDEGGEASPWGRLEFGATYNAVVVALKEYGVVLKAAASKKEKGGQLMVCSPEHAMEGVEEGNEVKVRVLGMDKTKGVVNVTMDTELVKAGRSKRRRAMVPFEAGETVSAKVVLAKPDAKWAVASTTDGRLLVVQVADFHCPHRTCQDAGLTPDTEDVDQSESPLEAKEFEACVGEAFSPGAEGYWASLEEGGDEGKANPNPYAGAALVTVVEGAGAGKRKAKRRKAQGEDLQLGDPSSDPASEGREQYCMKEGRVPLGKIKTGAKVVCEVIAVHWDRLDVKVAVKYPKSYGPRNGREERLAAMKAEQEAAAAASNGNKKRRRDQTTATASADDEEAAGANVKQIVRIRAKVHCAAAGLPGLDAPAKTEGEDGGGDDPGQLPDWHPLHKYDVGQVLKARVLRSEDVVQKKDSNLLFRLLELAVADPLEGDEDEDETKVSPVAWWGQTPPKMGEVHRGVVTEVAKHGVLVSLSASVRGLVPLPNISADRRVAKNFAALFKRGMGVRAVVCSVDGERKRLILKLAGVPTAKVLPDASLPAMLPGFVAKDEAAAAGEGSTDSPSPGDLVEGTVDLGVKAWAPPCLMVRLDGGGGMGRVCVTEVKEEEAWGKDPLKRFVDGQRVKCRVIHPSAATKSRSTAASTADGEANGGSFQPVELSLREYRLDPTRDAEEAARREDAPEVGSTAKCYVVSTGKSGCFVRLAGGVSGRVLLKLLSDRYVSNPALEFPCGRLVAGKVLEKDEATGHVSLTLQPSVVLDGKGGDGGCLSWGSESLKKGLKVKGRVAAVKDFGIFIQVDDSEVRGMCHRSEAADVKIKDLTQVYDEGDLVKALVLKVDRSKKRLSLGLKPSYFKDDPDSSDEESADSDSADEQEQGSSDEDDEDGGGGHKSLKAVSAMEVSDDSDDQAGTDEEQDDDEDEDSEEEDGSDEEEEEEEDSRSSKRPRSVLEAGLGGGGATGKGSNAFSLDFGNLGSMGGAGASSDEDEDSDDESDDNNGGGDGKGSKSHRSRKKAKERREEEDRITARERALQDEDGVPETAGDFERLMVAEPNNSLLWVKYMAFKLSLADVEGARSVAERGLKAVSFRLEQERFNVWVSLINLEHKYGTRATLKAVMERACQNTNPKKVHLHVAEMHEKAHEMEDCEEVFQATAKKFRHSKKVWVAYQLLRLRRGDDVGARQLLQRSLQSLSRHKHVSVISRFAQNEFEHGSVERGRSVFEGLMASYPKRLDLWNVYLDKEIKAGDLRAARNLLERLTGMDFNAKRMKGVFKKYLQFEMDHGDESGVEAVKAKATEYVASLAG